MTSEFDYILVGGGLQSGLLALALRARRPDATVGLVEKQTRLGGNHTWCFHQADVSQRNRQWIDPLVGHRWPGYRVRFPGFERSIEGEYAAISSERLHDVVLEALQRDGNQALLGTEAASIEAHRVTLADGSGLQARVVIDARGRGLAPTAAGYQKFLGQELEFAQPHGLVQPLLMDATVDQAEGFRFVYVLPFSETRLLVEDTYFSHDSSLDKESIRGRIDEYLNGLGMTVERLVREEEGILPMPWRQQHEMPQRGPLVAGYRGGFFHPGTGYSFPVAARLAALVAAVPPERLFGDALAGFAREHWRQSSFCHRLNDMLFRWFPPAQRWHIFRRFYGLPLETIEHFYALRLRTIDRARLVVGRPPRGMSLRYRFARGSSS